MHRHLASPTGVLQSSKKQPSKKQPSKAQSSKNQPSKEQPSKVTQKFKKNHTNIKNYYEKKIIIKKSLKKL